jgi:hypothetical protein
VIRPTPVQTNDQQITRGGSCCRRTTTSNSHHTTARSEGLPEQQLAECSGNPAGLAAGAWECWWPRYLLCRKAVSGPAGTRPDGVGFVDHLSTSRPGSQDADGTQLCWLPTMIGGNYDSCMECQDSSAWKDY